MKGNIINMRIISGKARGTKLYTLDGTATRPTLDRVKESLFNIIQNDIEDSTVLDLFSGSGAIGLEFLSRGAKRAVLCDSSKDAIKILKQKIDVPIIKAIQIKNDDSFNVDYDVDYYLFDHGSGGTGESFDWSMLKEVNKSVFLAGGINLSNIDEALKLNVYGLDVSSGVETDGFKDREKIKEIVRRVRNEG